MTPVLFLLCAALPTIGDQPPAGAVKLLRPGTRPDATRTASTSRAPWVDANGWRFRLDPKAQYLYDGVPPKWLPLSAAESFVYGGNAFIRTDSAGREALQPMLEFLKTLDARPMPPVSDFIFVDDGSPALGEIMNLLSRRNLLFTLARHDIASKDGNQKQASPGKLVVQAGTPDYPKEKTANPSEFAQLVRRKLTDQKRSLRIYGSEVIIGYLTKEGSRERLHLLNYGSDPVESFRVRVAGDWKVDRLASFGEKNMKVEELTYFDGGTEFGIPKLTTYAVVDLSRK